jgi:hypothetical protein
MEEKKMKLEPEQISLLRHVFRVFDAALENIDLEESGLDCDATPIKNAFYHLQVDLSNILGEDLRTTVSYYYL